MAAKIKDGLFIGDGDTSQSEDFINDNKISNLINLSGRELPNLWAAHGLVYMTFHWEDRPDFRLNLIPQNNKKSNEVEFVADIVEFVDVSIKHGISVLMFSKSGKGRCVVAVCLYLMYKYKWGFEKAFEFIYSKKPDITLNRGFVQQLFAFDRFQLMRSITTEKQQIAFNNIRNEQHEPSVMINLLASAVLSKEAYMRWKEWNPAYLLNNEKTKQNQIEVSYDNDELVLIYSFINSKVSITSLPGPYRSLLDAPPKKCRLRFNEVNFEEDVNMFPTNYPTDAVSPVRSALKGSSTEKKIKSASENGKNESSHEMKFSGANNNNSNRYKKTSDTNTQHNDTNRDSDLLYGFVGLMSNEPSSTQVPETRKSNDNRLISAEERLRKLVAGLSQPQSKSDIFDNQTSSESTIRDNKSNNEIPNQLNRSNNYPPAKESTFDPLLAFDMMQRSGVARARLDINLPENDKKSIGRKSAWTEDNSNSNNNNNTPNRSVSSRQSLSQPQQSWTPLSDQAQKIYRHGSPAPRSQQRGAAPPTTKQQTNRQSSLSNTLPDRYSIVSDSSRDRLLEEASDDRRLRQSLDRPDLSRRGSGSSLSMESITSEDNSLRPRNSSIDRQRNNMFSSPMRPVINRDASKTTRQPSPSQGQSNSRRPVVPSSNPSTGVRSSTPTKAWKF